MQAPDLDFWRTATLAFVALGQVAFVMLYATFPWYKSFLGRALFFKGFTFLLLTGFAVLARLLDLGGEDKLFVVLYALLGLGVWAQTLAFLRTRLTGKREGDGEGASGRAR